MSVDGVYVYRNFPSTVVPDEQLWYVGGEDLRGGSGVLEWCVDEYDAEDMRSKMKAHGQFKNLVAQSWAVEQDRCFVAHQNNSVQSV